MVVSVAPDPRVTAIVAVVRERTASVALARAEAARAEMVSIAVVRERTASVALARAETVRAEMVSIAVVRERMASVALARAETARAETGPPEKAEVQVVGPRPSSGC